MILTLFFIANVCKAESNKQIPKTTTKIIIAINKVGKSNNKLKSHEILKYDKILTNAHTITHGLVCSVIRLGFVQPIKVKLE